MRADIHDGQELKGSINRPDTEAQDQHSPNYHFRLATRGRSIQMGQKETFRVDTMPNSVRSKRPAISGDLVPIRVAEANFYPAPAWRSLDRYAA